LVTTYQISSDELDLNLINLIKNNFPHQELFIDVYHAEDMKFEINEISNPKIIQRIEDIKLNKNLIFPNIQL
jgi:hypothetical protein